MNLILIKFIEVSFILLSGTALIFIFYFIGVTDNQYVYNRMLPKLVKPVIKRWDNVCLLFLVVLSIAHVGIEELGLTADAVLYLLSIAALSVYWNDVDSILIDESCIPVMRNKVIVLLIILSACSIMFWTDMMAWFNGAIH